ncbi:Manganese ABC transporter substrate-binding lipoprotein, partial [Lacticaseibacillus paracasei subsp. paracasei Lpp123]
MKKILISVVAVLTMVAGVFWFVNNRSTTQKDSASTNQQ